MTWARVVVIDESMSMAKRVDTLKGVLSRNNTNRRQTIHICADINLTGEGPFEIWDCRKLIAPKGFARSPSSRGPLVYTDEMYSDGNASGRGALFKVHGDNVLISGFQLKGPTPGIGMGVHQHEKGILVSAVLADPDDESRRLPPIRNIVISNMEIYHWSGVGVQVDDRVDGESPRGRLLKTRPEAVRIVGCYFHHNRHGPGEGYGVNSSSGAYVTIEQNVFDENRHAIAGGSKNKRGDDYSGYTARDNLILAGGGVHIWDMWGNAAAVGGILGGIGGRLVLGPVGLALGAAGAAIAGAAVKAGLIRWKTHQIDMHGTKNFRGKEEWCCGTAGETIIIERNTVLYDGKGPWWYLQRGPAIKIRGNPRDRAAATDNVFRHENEAVAIRQNGDPYVTRNNLTLVTGIAGIALSTTHENITKPIEKSGNAYASGDLTATLAKGDFFGNYEHGEEDDFMATGVTWWARSPVTGQWRYLNTMPEQLPELRLVKADNDNVWDVMPRYTPTGELEKYSKGGRTPWQPLIRM